MRYHGKRKHTGGIILKLNMKGGRDFDPQKSNLEKLYAARELTIRQTATVIRHTNRLFATLTCHR
jgi:hypothetical protein